MYLQTAKRNLFAKGRLKKGQLNKTEASYKSYLEGEVRAGRVAAFWFEGLKLKVADGACWYTPDFLVLRPNGDLELHEVKGSPRIVQDDARVKMKAVCTQYPFRLFLVFPRPRRDGCGWEIEEFLA
jgi:hypothetical protein